MRFEPEFVTGEGIENKRVVQIACGQEHTVALTSEGDLYAWGSNRFGQLGTGLTADETNPAKISGFNGLAVLDFQFKIHGISDRVVFIFPDLKFRDFPTKASMRFCSFSIRSVWILRCEQLRMP